MSTYLVDFENVGVGGMDGVEKLSDCDRVVIFYGKQAAAVPFERHIEIASSRAEVRYIKVDKTGKNFLDFQLSSYCGYLIGSTEEKDFIIISRDNGFGSMEDFWDGKEMSGKLISMKRQPAIVVKEEKPENVREIIVDRSDRAGEKKEKRAEQRAQGKEGQGFEQEEKREKGKKKKGKGRKADEIQAEGGRKEKRALGLEILEERKREEEERRARELKEREERKQEEEERHARKLREREARRREEEERRARKREERRREEEERRAREAQAREARRREEEERRARELKEREERRQEEERRARELKEREERRREEERRARELKEREARRQEEEEKRIREAQAREARRREEEEQEARERENREGGRRPEESSFREIEEKENKGKEERARKARAEKGPKGREEKNGRARGRFQKSRRREAPDLAAAVKIRETAGDAYPEAAGRAMGHPGAAATEHDFTAWEKAGSEAVSAAREQETGERERENSLVAAKERPYKRSRRRPKGRYVWRRPGMKA